MKKLMIGVLSLACLSLMAAAATMQVNSVSAEEQQATSIFTETKCQISKTGDRMLMVTGITDVSKIYEMGYEISGGYQVQEGDVAETNMYYESLTLGGSTKTASEFIEGAEGLLIWEIDYDCDYTYTVQAYAYVGVLNQSGQLTIPEVEEKTYGIKKESFNLVTVTFVDEEGTTIDTQSVTIGNNATSIAAPKKDNAEFEGWYMDGEKYDFGAAVKKNITLTAKYKHAVNYTVKVETAKYAQAYASSWYFPGALSYVDATSEYAPYLGLNENGVASAMAGTEVDLTESLASLPAGVKVSEESVLTGVVAEDGSLELSVKLDIDEDYLGFKLSNIKFGDYSCDGFTFSLAMMNGIVGLEIKATKIGNGKSLYIDIDDVDKAVTPSLVINYYTKAVNETKVAVADENGTYTAFQTFSAANADTTHYFGDSIDLFEKFSTVNKISVIRFQYLDLNNGPRDIFIAGVQARDYAPKKNVEYTVENGKLASAIMPLAMGTIGQEAHNYPSIGATKNSVHYSFADKEPGDKYLKIGVALDLGGAIQVRNYASIKVLFQTTAQKVADGALNAGTLVFINGVVANPGGEGHTGTYYNGSHTTDLIALAKEMNIETIKTVEIVHSQWGDRNNIHMYIGSVSFQLAAGVSEDVDDTEVFVSESVTYSADNGNIMSIAKAIGNITLTTESNYEVGGVYNHNLCYRHPDAISGSTLPGEHIAGIIFNLGKIKVSDYKTIKVKFRAVASIGNKTGTVIYLNGFACETKYGGPQEVDLKAMAEGKGISVLETLELSCANWEGVPDYNLFVAYIELVVAD